MIVGKRAADQDPLLFRPPQSHKEVSLKSSWRFALAFASARVQRDSQPPARQKFEFGLDESDLSDLLSQS